MAAIWRPVWRLTGAVQGGTGAMFLAVLWHINPMLGTEVGQFPRCADFFIAGTGNAPYACFAGWPIAVKRHHATHNADVLGGGRRAVGALSGM